MKRTAIIFLLLLFGFTAHAFAEEDGHVFIMPESRAALMSEENDIEPLFAQAGIYYCSDYEKIKAMGVDESNIMIDCRAELYEYPYDTNDPLYPKQWGLDAIRAWRLREKGMNGSGVRVGIIDTGILASHEDFAGLNIDAGKNLCAESAGKQEDIYNVTDTNGHGSFACSVIAAQTSNGVGIAGIADKCTVVPLRVQDSEYPSHSLRVSVICKAMNEAVEADCDIVNMSLGFTNPAIGTVNVVRSALKALSAHNIWVIAPVGNDYNTGINSLSYPAAFDEVIGVSSVQNSNGTYSISPFARRNGSTFVTAPGSGIQGISIASNTSYKSWSGTSFSSPAVAGVAACIRQMRPDMTVEEFKEALIETSADLGDEGFDDEYGWGLIDAAALVDYISAPTPTAPQIKDIEIVYNEGNVSFVGSEFSTAVLIEADYDAAGELIKVNTYNIKDNKESVDIGADTAGARLMLWSGTDKMEPLADAVTVK